MQTKTRSNGSKTTPQLGDILSKKRGPGRPKKTRTAEQIANDLETEAKRLQGAADILRGKA